MEHVSYAIGRRGDNFFFDFTEQGVYLQVRSVDVPLDELYVVFMVQHMRLLNPDLRGALSALRNKERRVLIATPQEAQQYGEAVYLAIPPDDMLVQAELVKPTDTGAPLLTENSVMGFLRENRVHYGVIEAAVREMLEARQYGQCYKIAEGKPVTNGENASVQFHFNRHFDGRAKIVEGSNDRVDYRDLEMFENVTAGQPLITRTPPTLGEDGMNVRGVLIKAKPGKDLPMPRGKNVVISADNCTMIAEKDGHVVYEQGRVVVNTVYTVPGDVDMSTGNIDFLGDVLVRGGVIANMTIRATGSIEVKGMVEASTLIAQGSIVLHAGIQGGDKGLLRAQGDITSRIVERAKVYAQGDFSAETVLHSHVECGGNAFILGRRGSIIGGIARAQGDVSVRNAGSNKGVHTRLEAGVVPEKTEELQNLKQEKKKMESENARIDVLYRTLGEEPIPGEKPERAELRIKMLTLREAIPARLEHIEQQIKEIQKLMGGNTLAKVHVLETVYNGVHIHISNTPLILKEPVTYATFYLKEGEIRYRACEFIV